MAVVGFAIGVALLVVVPAARSGEGIFGLFVGRTAPVPEIRIRPPSQVRRAPAAKNERPELWMTPVAVRRFPTDGGGGGAREPGAVRARFLPSQTDRGVALPILRDAIGRPVVSAFAVFSTDDDPTIVGPLRPEIGEPSRVTLLATTAGSEEVAACVLALRGRELRAVGAVGSADLEGCQAGLVRLPDDRGLSFEVTYDELPNYRARDGGWREGAVLGRTELSVALKAGPS